MDIFDFIDISEELKNKNNNPLNNITERYIYSFVLIDEKIANELYGDLYEFKDFVKKHIFDEENAFDTAETILLRDTCKKHIKILDKYELSMYSDHLHNENNIQKDNVYMGCTKMFCLPFYNYVLLVSNNNLKKCNMVSKILQYNSMLCVHLEVVKNALHQKDKNIKELSKELTDIKNNMPAYYGPKVDPLIGHNLPCIPGGGIPLVSYPKETFKNTNSPLFGKGIACHASNSGTTPFGMIPNSSNYNKDRFGCTPVIDEKMAGTEGYAYSLPL